MPRKPRMTLPGVPSHIVQRGNDRHACFFEEENYLFYLHCLEEASKRYRVAVHAYVLMTNYVHLLMTPVDEQGISRVMQLVGNRYVQYVNKRYRRTGTLWEGRHKGSLVDAERYLLSCYRYIELNPVRAGMVSNPADYRWSSYRHNAKGESSTIVTAHALFMAISPTIDERRHHYRALLRAGMNDDELKEIRKAATFSMPLGSERFKSDIETMLGRGIGQSHRGKPRRGMRVNVDEKDSHVPSTPYRTTAAPSTSAAPY